MPIFEYKCNSCGKEFSKLVPSFSTPDSDVECTECHEKKVERRLSMKAAIGGSSSKGGGCSAPAGSGFS